MDDGKAVSVSEGAIVAASTVGKFVEVSVGARVSVSVGMGVSVGKIVTGNVSGELVLLVFSSTTGTGVDLSSSTVCNTSVTTHKIDPMVKKDSENKDTRKPRFPACRR